MGVTSVGNTATIQSAIAVASRTTGIDFNYLMGQAQIESGMRADARASTSSASGLYQFVEQSWLGVVKAHGAEHGLGWASDSIRQTSSGRYVVNGAATRRAILDLRNDPQAASLMAAEHASDNKDSLEASLGRPASGTDLYMAHFLGLGGARSFLSAMDASPGRTGAAMFPAAARANRNIFYAAGGRPRTLSEIYSTLSDKLGQGAGAAATAPAASPDWAAALGQGGEIVLGAGAAGGDEAWLNSTLANLNSLREPMNPLRPTPQNAKLAYLMLASLGA
ncbi:MAG: lytic transglycosylase domain-containing protein [Sphingomonas sp.]